MSTKRDEFLLRVALDRAFNFGQRYWIELESEPISTSARSDAVLSEFDAFAGGMVATLGKEPEPSDGAS